MFSLISSRLTFRNYKGQDLDFLQGMLASPAMMKYIGDGSTKNIQGAEAFLQWIFRHYQENGQLGLKVIEHSQTKTRLGHAGIVPQLLENHLYYEIGYWIVPEFQGHGYAKEAARNFFRFGKEELRLEKMIAFIQPHNTASIRVAKSIPMQFEAERCLNEQLVHIYSNTTSI